MEIPKVHCRKFEKYFDTTGPLSYFPGAFCCRYPVGDDWAIGYVSPYIEKLTGYSPQSFPSSTLKDIILDEDRSLVLQTVRQALDRGQTFSLTYRIIHRDGYIKNLIEYGKGLYDAQGTLMYLSSTIFDLDCDKQIESNRDFKAIFEEADLGIVITDSELNILKINKVVTKILGYEIHDVLGRNVREFTNDGEIDAITEDYVKREKQYLTKDTILRWITLHVVKLEAKKEKDVRYLAFLEDIDDKKLYEQNRQRDFTFERTINTISQYLSISKRPIDKKILWGMEQISHVLSVDRIEVFFYDDSRDIVNWQHGWAREESLAIPHNEAYTTYLNQYKDSPIFHRLLRNNTVIVNDINVLNLPKEQNYLALYSVRSIALFPFLQSGDFYGAIAYSTAHSTLEFDQSIISFLRRTSDLLLAAIYRDRIEKEQALLLTKLTDKNKELKDFAHVISHDLKAPLRGVKTLANWIKQDNQSNFNAESMEDIELLIQRVHSMEQFIEGVLTYSSLVDTSTVNDRQTNLNNSLRNVLTLLEIPSHIEIIIPENLPSILIDPYRVEQIFINLVSNAIRYANPNKGLIRIGYRQLDHHHLFSVSDNGPGIDKANIKKIFHLFETLHDAQSSTGIGLSIVKEIVNAYGGNIWVESNPEGGSSFFFTLKTTPTLPDANK